MIDAALGGDQLPTGHLPADLGLWRALCPAAEVLLGVGGENVVLAGAEVLNLCVWGGKDGERVRERDGQERGKGV